MGTTCTKAASLAGLAGIGATVMATPTVVLTIPIADVLRHREAMVQYTMAGSERSVDPKIYHSNGLTIGLFDRLEIGLGNDFEGTTALSAKLLLYEDPKDGTRAVSFGIANWKDGRADKYIAARHDFAGFRLHGGWYQNDRNRMMLGLDAPIGADTTVLFDFTSGPGSRIWGGLAGSVPGIDGLVWTVAGGAPIERSDGYQVYINLAFVARF